jgi:hypothetical protein
MQVIPERTVAVARPTTSSFDGDALAEHAARLGFELATREADTGQLVWEWRHRDNGPCPQFVTERVARHWMDEWIEHFETAGRVELVGRAESESGDSTRQPERHIVCDGDALCRRRRLQQYRLG